MPTLGEKKRRDDNSCRVKVHIRLKRCTEKEGATYNTFADGTQLHIPNHEGRLELDRWYKFDHIYSSIASNKEVYRFSTYDLVESAIKGINTAIFAYGQTGSGKTHTLMSKDGVTAHMVSHLFNRIWKSEEDFKVTCSYFQIYNEHIYDLLNPQNASECGVREDVDGEVFVENVTNVVCETPMDVYELINIGRKSLIIAETKMSRLSCRAHTVCQLAIEKRKSSPREKKRSMQETYSAPDISFNNDTLGEKKTRIDFTTVPFNKADLRKRHSIAVTKINESRKSPRIPRSPSVSHTRIPIGFHRSRSGSLRSRNRKKSPSPSGIRLTPETLAPIKSPLFSRSPEASGNSGVEGKNDEDQSTMNASIGLDSVRKLHDLYQSNIANSDTDIESLHFESENSFTFSEGCSDDYDSYYHEDENSNEADEYIFDGEKETNGHGVADLTVRRSKISIVDLAGSERLSETNVDCERLKEAQNINLSLLELGNVVSALASGKKKHVPYRNSVLTRLLQDSLGGNCKTKFLLCISTKHVDANETKSTLEFGQKLTQVYTNPIINQDVDYQRKYEQLLRQLQNDENVYEKRKTELIERISVEKEELRKQEETKCGHDKLLSSLEIKLDHATLEHDESTQKIMSLRETLFEQENVMKKKEEEILKLQFENENLFERINSKCYSNETLSTLDAMSVSSPELMLNDVCDDHVLASSVSDGDLIHIISKYSTNSLENIRIDRSTESDVANNDQNNNILKNSTFNDSQDIDFNTVANDNGLTENSDITSSMECHANSSSYLSDDVTDFNTISINSPTLLKVLTDAIQHMPSEDNATESFNQSPVVSSTNDKKFDSGKIIEFNVPSENNSTEQNVVDTSDQSIRKNMNHGLATETESVKTGVTMDKYLLRDILIDGTVDVIDSESLTSATPFDAEAITRNHIDTSDTSKNIPPDQDLIEQSKTTDKKFNSGKIIEFNVPSENNSTEQNVVDTSDQNIRKNMNHGLATETESIKTGVTMDKYLIRDILIDGTVDVIDSESLTSATPLDAEATTRNHIDTSDTSKNIPSDQDLIEQSKTIDNDNENNTLETTKPVGISTPENCQNNESSNELEQDTKNTQVSSVIDNDHTRIDLSNEKEVNHIEKNSFVEDIRNVEYEASNENVTIENDIEKNSFVEDIGNIEYEVSNENVTIDNDPPIQTSTPAIEASRFEHDGIRDSCESYDAVKVEISQEDFETNRDNDFPIQTSTPENEVLNVRDSLDSSSLDYLHSSSQDSFAFTDVSEDSTVGTVESITNIDDDYAIDLYTPTPVETCNMATNTTDDELSNDVIFAGPGSPNPGIRANPIVVTFVKSPKADSTLRGKSTIKTRDSTSNTPVWNWWSPSPITKNVDDDSSQSNLASQFDNEDTLRAAVLVELTRIQRLCEQTKDPMEDLQSEFEMIGSIEGSNSTLNEGEPEPVINDAIYSVLNEILGVVPNIVRNSSRESMTTALESTSSPSKSKPESSKTKSETPLDVLQDYLEERKRLLNEELKYIVEELSNNNENDGNAHYHKGGGGALSESKLIDSLIHLVASGRIREYENVDKLNDLLDIIISLHTIISILITISRWPRTIFDVKTPTHSELQLAKQQQRREESMPNSSYKTGLKGSPRDCPSFDGNSKVPVKRSKSFLNRFLCMPTKSSKTKK